MDDIGKSAAWRTGGVAATFALALCAIGGTYLLAERRVDAEVRASSARQLDIISRDLESILERSETLPYSLSFDTTALQVLREPGDAAAVHRLNLVLQSVQRQAQVSAIYMMDRNGKALAASNWDQPLNFVGRNFVFRPYFSNAANGKPGRFYGIGTATGEPGYFITQPIFADAAGYTDRNAVPEGVMAVKVDLSELERNWRSSEEPLALADANGVVFLCNRQDWKYHGLHPLSKAVQDELVRTYQYARKEIVPIATLPASSRSGFAEPVAHSLGHLGWQLMLFPSEARIQRTALSWAAASALLLTLAGISFLAWHQRRRRMEERLLSRQAMQRAREELETAIEQRTGELLTANKNLEIKLAKLEEADSLLRSTQNELVQAGKLTMLGQIAAGIAHELTQPLAAIQAFADNAIVFLARGQAKQTEQNLTHISSASAHIGEIVRQLKGFASSNRDDIAPVDLAKAVESAAVLLQNEFRRRGAQLKVQSLDDLAVSGDRVRIEQVLINLMHNALDALDALDTIDAGERKEVTVILERADAQAVVHVCDSGAGIAKDMVPHLFEPFHSTKTAGRHLGLGLAIAATIVQATNGKLTAQNRTEGGAEFIVTWPLAAPSTQQEK